MQKKIAETTGTFAMGNPYQRKLFQIKSGTYSGRMVSIFQSSVNEIQLSWSDNPGSSWSTPQSLVTNAANSSFDCLMDSAGNIHLVYSEITTDFLVTYKLTFGAGSWTVGSKVTIYNGHQCFDPSIAIETGGKLWVSFSRFETPNRAVYIKSSNDSGASWGSGPADTGTNISNLSMFIYSKVIIDFININVIYTVQSQAILIQSLPLSGGSWSSAYSIATGTNFSQEFDAAIGVDGRLGVAFKNQELYYREFDGNNWGAVVNLEDISATAPQLFFRDNIPIVVFLKSQTGAQKTTYYTDRRTGIFSAPKILDYRSSYFKAVLLYDNSSETYEDLTSQSQSQAAADVYHTGSGSIIKDIGDKLYLGMDEKFRFTRLLLSTVAVGGTVMFSYWDGLNWQSFTPVSGASDFSTSQVDLIFWTDYSSIPANWQKQDINSQIRYWLKIEVVSSFSTGAVGSEISALSESSRVIYGR